MAMPSIPSRTQTRPRRSGSGIARKARRGRAGGVGVRGASSRVSGPELPGVPGPEVAAEPGEGTARPSAAAVRARQAPQTPLARSSASTSRPPHAAHGSGRGAAAGALATVTVDPVDRGVAPSGPGRGVVGGMAGAPGEPRAGVSGGSAAAWRRGFPVVTGATGEGGCCGAGSGVRFHGSERSVSGHSSAWVALRDVDCVATAASYSARTSLQSTGAEVEPWSGPGSAAPGWLTGGAFAGGGGTSSNGTWLRPTTNSS